MKSLFSWVSLEAKTRQETKDLRSYSYGQLMDMGLTTEAAKEAIRDRGW